MIGNIVEAEVVPRPVRHERIHFDGVVGSRPQPDQSRDDQIAIRRVVVVNAPREIDDPFPRGRVEVFRDPWLAVLVLRAA